MTKQYEIPEDVAVILRNAGIPVITKHYVEQVEHVVCQSQQAQQAALPVPEYIKPAEPVVTRRKKRKTPKPYSRHTVELGQYTPEELGLRRGRRFYGDMAQRILMHHQRGIKRHVLLNTMDRMDRYDPKDTVHSIGCQITNLVKLGVLSYKAKDNG